MQALASSGTRRETDISSRTKVERRMSTGRGQRVGVVETATLAISPFNLHPRHVSTREVRSANAREHLGAPCLNISQVAPPEPPR